VIRTAPGQLDDVQIGSALFVVGRAYLDLSLAIAFGENLLEACLEHPNVVIDDCLLLRRMLLAHDAHQSQISGSC
jgi:hypothetical protein